MFTPLAVLTLLMVETELTVIASLVNNPKGVLQLKIKLFTPQGDLEGDQRVGKVFLQQCQHGLGWSHLQ